jgi:hypothetical protein
MFRATVVTGFAIVGLAVLVAVPGLSQQEKTEPPPAVKGQLPKYWSKIGLSDDQKQKVYAIHATYLSKIESLRRQIKDLQQKEKGEQEKLLTDDQRAALRRILLEKAPKASGEGAAIPDKK